MSKRKTKEEFIEEAMKVHGDKYDYSLVKYINNSTKVIIIYEKYNTKHLISPNKLLNGVQCAMCNSLDKTIYLKKKVNKLHGDKYNLSEVLFESWSKGVIVIDKEYNTKHLLYPHNLICGDNTTLSNAIDKKEYIIKRFKEVHGDIYDYSLVEAKEWKEKVIIIDKKYNTKHLLSIDNHIKGNKCRLSNAIDKNEYVKYNFEEVHGDTLFDYSDINYINYKSKLKIKCKKHNFTFKQIFENHLKCGGCPKCRSSRGERSIIKFLEENSIIYELEKTFRECMYKSRLQFDFYLPKYNCCIEYDGELHYKPIECFGGIDGHNGCKKRDIIKNKYCDDNDIKLIRIPYWDFDNIEPILTKEFNSIINN